MKKFFGLATFLVLSACQYFSDSHNQDVLFMYNQVIENHPGIYNRSDPNFKNALERALKSADQALHAGVNQKIAIEHFVKSFDDVHVWVHWHSQSSALENKKLSEFKIKQSSPGIIWITLPTFGLNKNQNLQFEAMLKEIPNHKNNSAIVFDLRGNQGGSSHYGSQLIDFLFGKLYAEKCRALANGKTCVDWRASHENLSHVQNLHKRYGFTWLEQAVNGMQNSINNEDPYYHQTSFNVLKHDEKSLKNTVHARVIVVIDQHNMSAALDFIDELKMMAPQIILVGKETKADRLYMEVRTVELPSELGTFSFPIKVYRNRKRGDKVPYVPDYEHDTNDSTGLEHLITDVIEKSR
jgi:hypothetical protein